MLVIAGKLRSGAEKRVVSWLRKWQGDYRVPGVAIANCFVSGQEIDLVIITPHTTVACEIKGLSPEITGGVLHCTTNSRWKVSGFEGDPVSVRQNDTTPYDQVRDGVFKLKAAAAGAGGPTFVTGLVVVAPPRGSNLRLDKKSAPQGCDVLLCNTQNPMRAWFHRAHHRSAVVWTAEQAYALIESLEHGDSTTVAALAAEGFPVEEPQESPPPPPREPAPAKPTAPASAPRRPLPAPPEPPGPPPSPPAPAPALSAPPRIENQNRTADPPPAAPPTIEEATPAPVLPTRAPAAELPAEREPDSFDQRSRRRQTVASLAAIVGLAAGLWLITQLGHDRAAPRDTTGHQQNSAVTEHETTPPPPPATKPPEPRTPTACFPFQPGC